MLPTIISIVLFYCFSKLPAMTLLSTLGRYSLQIYLLHVYVTAGMRVIFKLANISNIYLYFILSTVIGLAIPTIIGITFSKFPILNTVFSPINSFKKIKLKGKSC